MSTATLPSTPTSPAITWSTLTRLEPKLLDLLSEAKCRGKLAREVHGTGYDPNGPFFGYSSYQRPGLKDALKRLVGFGREADADPLLCSSDAYEVATNAILDALEAC